LEGKRLGAKGHRKERYKEITKLVMKMGKKCFPSKSKFAFEFK
jgi:hypothetical protein